MLSLFSICCQQGSQLHTILSNLHQTNLYFNDIMRSSILQIIASICIVTNIIDDGWYLSHALSQSSIGSLSETRSSSLTLTNEFYGSPSTKSSASTLARLTRAGGYSSHASNELYLYKDTSPEVIDSLGVSSIFLGSPVLLPDRTSGSTNRKNNNNLVSENSSTSEKISFVDISWLKAHEEVVSVERVHDLRKATLEWGAYKLPLLVDSESGAILDGHHRYAVGSLMGLSKLPVILVDYLNDDSISLDVWPDCGIDCLTKEDVIKMSLSEKLFPPKTSKHAFIDTFSEIHVPLSKLR